MLGKQKWLEPYLAYSLDLCYLHYHFVGVCQIIVHILESSVPSSCLGEWVREQWIRQPLRLYLHDNEISHHDILLRVAGMRHFLGFFGMSYRDQTKTSATIQNHGNSFIKESGQDSCQYKYIYPLLVEQYIHWYRTYIGCNSIDLNVVQQQFGQQVCAWISHPSWS